ncbi:MAG: DUF1768 domain-containing protein [Lachnospiraceae bacterium]|nr:DUF1768 domain-containing protein [Lachnospiraceae bacterium]
MSKIVVFSGSFNPPTIAHKRLLTAAVDGVGADQGIFVPSNNAYVNKEMAKTGWPFEILSERRRSLMLNALCAGDDRLSVDEGEYSSDGTSGNIIDVHKRVQKKYDTAEQLWFLFEGDKLRTFTKWQTFGEFDENCRIVVFRREGFDPEYEIEHTKALRELRDRFVILPMPEGIEGISSEAVRDAVRKGDEEAAKAMLIPEIFTLLACSSIRKETVIRSFRGKYEFLSNFYKAEVEFEGLTYPTSEAAFQAAKCIRREERIPFTKTKSPAIANRMGQKVNLRRKWESEKVGIMERIVRAKFKQHPELAEKLTATGSLPIMEENNRHDTFWGVDISTGRGENRLGKILMKVRKELGGAGDTSANVILRAASTPSSAVHMPPFEEKTSEMKTSEEKTSEEKNSLAVREDSDEKQLNDREEEEVIVPEIDFEIGMLFSHPIFGEGIVTGVSGKKRSRILDVEFPDLEPKRMRAEWVERYCTIISE